MVQAIAEKEQSETKRDRVRRLLLDRLKERGFRMRRAQASDEVDFLNRVADAVSYMSDHGLRVLCDSLLTKGEGASKCFWPSYATIVGLAEAFEPLPVEHAPNLASWFQSKAGMDAVANDRLVAEFLFFQNRKRPPVSDQERRTIASRAREWADKAARIQDRINRGLQPFADDGQWLAWFKETEKRAMILVKQGKEARDAI